MYHWLWQAATAVTSPERALVSVCEWPFHISPRNSRWTPGVFCIYFYNRACRLRLEKILYLERPRSPNGFFNHVWIQVAVSEAKRSLTKPFRKLNVKRLQIYNGYNMQRPFPNGKKCPFGCNGYVTAVAAGQSQRLYVISWYGSL
jgi:hypothetical protein